MKPSDFEEIDWDPEEDEDGNLAHCLRHGVDEQVVDHVLGFRPVKISMCLVTAELAIVGPEEDSGTFWTLLFDRSYKRGDWLRPVTGWKSEPEEIDAWNRGRQL